MPLLRRSPRPAQADVDPIKAALTREVSSDGERFTFFWSKHDAYSNWYPCRFVVDDIEYNCNEQFMMAEKARLFGDIAVLADIMKTDDPKVQKALGKAVKPFVESVWKREARPIVRRGAHAKFSQNEDLLKIILASEGTTLVEASKYDRIWGIGLEKSDPRAWRRETWLGTNWLGEELTDLRDVDLIPEARQRELPGLRLG